MKKYFADSKAAKERTKQKRMEADRRVAEPPSYHSRESEEALLQMMRYRLRLPFRRAWMISIDKRRWPDIESDLDYHVTNLNLDQQLVGENSNLGLPQLESSVVEGADSTSSLLGAFGSRRSFRDTPAGAIIHDLDPHAFFSKDSK